MNAARNAVAKIAVPTSGLKHGIALLGSLGLIGYAGYESMYNGTVMVMLNIV